jgi:hypothetical protein
MEKEFYKILEIFREEFCEAVNYGLIRDKTITSWKIASEENLHSKIQYVLIKAGEKAGFISIPEVKIKQEPTNYGMGNKKQSRYKTDVAFFSRENRLIGISEIFTIDMLAHILPIEKLKEKYPEIDFVTSATKILYLLEHSFVHIDNILFVFVLPRNAINLPSYPDFRKLVEGSKNLFEKFSPYIEDLKFEIKKMGKNPYCIKITEINDIKLEF